MVIGYAKWRAAAERCRDALRRALDYCTEEIWDNGDDQQGQYVITQCHLALQNAADAYGRIHVHEFP